MRGKMWGAGGCAHMQNKLLPVSPTNKTRGMAQGLLTTRHSAQVCGGGWGLKEMCLRREGRWGSAYLRCVVEGDCDVEPHNGAKKQSDLDDGKCGMHEAAALVEA